MGICVYNSLSSHLSSKTTASLSVKPTDGGDEGSYGFLLFSPNKGLGYDVYVLPMYAIIVVWGEGGRLMREKCFFVGRYDVLPLDGLGDDCFVGYDNDVAFGFLRNRWVCSHGGLILMRYSVSWRGNPEVHMAMMTRPVIVNRDGVTTSQPVDIWDDIISGKVEEDCSVLLRFLTISFAELKRLNFDYSIAFPTLVLNPPAILADLKPTSEWFTAEED
ncbi:hypothetical protein M8C21_016226 [Ambrosia artemisiifolia]|uniref:Ubiquitin-like modifier-activating enzyme Atg7 N-terminal domain-containing protein n=1 Tax=Ambrosia artemisiifolia TaxID=4212 RepID=A0AAD5GME0_AMBAR|nr:hypothetical protein M8C21_016226 [Ambrosia artemisiifolia]